MTQLVWGTIWGLYFWDPARGTRCPKVRVVWIREGEANFEPHKSGVRFLIVFLAFSALRCLTSTWQVVICALWQWLFVQN